MKDPIFAALAVFDGTINGLKSLKKMLVDVEFGDAVKLLSKTERVWTLGMGKAGFVAQKLASTLSSNSVPAAFIHAGEALHGEMGAIRSDDVLVAFSNSGKTVEVVQVVEKAYEKRIKVILITGHGGSLAAKADVILLYGKVAEACPLGLTPTTSIAVMLALSDALAMAVQTVRGLTPAEYAWNHHAGYLGEIAREKARKQ